MNEKKVYQDYRKRLSALGDEESRKSVSERLKRVEKRLDEINGSNQDVETKLRRKIDKIKSQLDTDEVKFNEESLKKLKPDVERLISSIGERMRTLRKDRDELVGLFSTSGDATTTPADILTRVECELRDTSAYKQVCRELNSIFSAANVVRPLSNASDGPSMIDSTGDAGEDILNCRPSQKCTSFFLI